MASGSLAQSLTIGANYITAKLIGASKEAIDLVADFLAYQVEVEHMSATRWDGRSSFYSRSSDTFPAGFVHMVHDELRRNGHQVRLALKETIQPLGPENPIVDKYGNDNSLYDFQLDALRQVEKHKRGIIQVATGGGKSRVAKFIAARYRAMTLFLTTRGILMYQMADGFKDAGFNCGLIGDGEFTPKKGINCGMVQTFIAKLKEPDLSAEVMTLIAANAKLEKPEMLSDVQIAIEADRRFKTKTAERARFIKLLSLVEVVIGEEAHEAGGASYYEILRHCSNASIRVALTATPFMRSDSKDNMQLMAAFGPILIKVSEKLLIDRGILATPSFRFYTSRRPPKLYRTTPWKHSYTIGYVENEFMNADIVAEAKRAAGVGLPVMTLVVRKNHGKTLEKLMREAGLRVAYIRGENDQAERKRELRRLGNGELDVLIGTTILDVGVDVPAVGLVQLAGGYKAEIALRQRVGRGLRAKKGVANVAFITDYGVELNMDLAMHTAQRRAIIQQTEGFGERILPEGQDHDWSIFAAKSAL